MKKSLKKLNLKLKTVNNLEQKNLIGGATIGCNKTHSENYSEWVRCSDVVCHCSAVEVTITQTVPVTDTTPPTIQSLDGRCDM